MPKYHKKPIIVEALQLKWDTWKEMCGFAGVGKLAEGKPEGITLPNAKMGFANQSLEGLIL